MKKGIGLLLCVVLAGQLGAGLVFAQENISDKAETFRALGQSQWESFQRRKEGRDQEPYAEGTYGVITKDEMEMTTQYFLISGQEEQEARENAYEQCMITEALYQKAVREGFEASQEEVQEYVEELKKTIESTDNAQEVQNVIQAFGSQDEYWEFETMVYEKLLPVEKYVKSLRENYFQEVIDNEELQKITVEEYIEEQKRQLVEEEAFNRIK